MISRFFTKKQRERENREKKAGKRETATTLVQMTNFDDKRKIFVIGSRPPNTFISRPPRRQKILKKFTYL
jgi:hypothetical protein